MARFSAGRLRERQLDDLSGRALTDGELLADLCLTPDDRQRDRAVGGGEAGGADGADLPLAEAQGIAGRGEFTEAKPAKGSVRLAAVVEAGHRLLADVAPLLEVDGALDDAGLRGHVLGAHVEPEPRPAGL